ncbi:ABC transporter substrate-binding protein [Deinococcus cellulosilyticus]|uniref:ABC transporter substrate-binding protein n=1 Tax=Deinococcus cellulosilyticus (strain DSM 18568 / NBRC 106333 / KACC 11606 / 5516J-15) TaxID=1223518 RepID=A0A511MWC6_DEIC1|nr:ABC transporter substrate-binding protein [Deinococcus cellulosilyticus]GEM44426.1 ABC transporter substrate-binding protein [Deinococcus cellulosilyticus NBRC 106333 = KACC 11606]
MKRTAVLSTLALLTAALTVTTAQAAEPQHPFTVVRTLQWGSFNLNPFTPNDQHLPPTLSAIYETLFFVNNLNGKVTNVLGTKYRWSKDNLTLTVNTRDGVKWNDGKAFSANDVEFTFNYLKKHNLSSIWSSGLTSVTATNDNTVVFKFKEPNAPIFPFIATQAIVPEHIWSKVQNPTQETNQKAVGTGPFIFDSYSQQALRVLKNPNYWMKDKPYIDAIVWLPTNGNDAALLKMLKAEGDFSYIGLTDPRAQYASKGKNNTYWWPVNSTNFLYFNNAKAPFSDVAFRRAIAQGINTDEAALKAYAGVLKGADVSAVIPAQKKVWFPTTPGDLDLKFDPAAADRALTAAGYKKDSNGRRLGKDGKPLPTFRILVGAGWTDYITLAQVVSDNLEVLGINSTVDQQAFSGYITEFQTGTYDMGVSWSWGTGPSPYYLFYQSFHPNNTAPVGQTSPSNLTRYTNPVVTKALDEFRATSNAAAQKKALATAVTQVMKDLPWLPLTDRSQFGIFNTTRFTNFPSDKNPYYDGNVDDQAGTRLLFLNVKPR